MAITYDGLMLSLEPVAYWRCDETSTNFFDEVDSAEASLSGTYSRGADSLLAGDSNYAVTMSNAAARTGTGAKWRLGEGDFAVSMILKYTTTAFNTAFSIRVYNSTPLLLLITTSRISSGDVSAETWAWSDASKRVRSSAINDGNPHHVVVEYVHSTTMLNLYVDGELIDSRAQGSGRTTTATTMGLGIGNNWGANQPFVGVLDEVAVFNQALGGENVAALYTIFSEGPQEEVVTLTADASWRVQADRGDQSSWRIATDLEGNSSWRTLERFPAEIASRILDEGSASSAWKVLDQATHDSTWGILNDFSNGLASRILTRVEPRAGWRILRDLSLDVSWEILSPSEFLEAVLSYRLFTALERQFSSDILVDMEGASAWKVFGAEEKDLAHRILTFKQASTASRILAATEGVLGWPVLNGHARECRWTIEALIRQVNASMGWRVLTGMDEDLAWVLLSSCEEFICDWLIVGCLAQRLAWRACGKAATERPVFTCKAKSSQHAFFSR